jgi:hypothetical protein
MNARELFEFQDYLLKEDLKKVEYIFASQCINNEFKEFKTSLGSISKDYLSYLVAASLMDKTIANDKDGYEKFFKIANGFTERFFQNVIYHAYNLSEIYGKENVFDELIGVGMNITHKDKEGFIEFKDFALHNNIEDMIKEMNMSNSGVAVYSLSDYAEYHKKLQIYVLKDELQEELPTNAVDRPKNKL